jgi:hypothetical protein
VVTLRKTIERRIRKQHIQSKMAPFSLIRLITISIMCLIVTFTFFIFLNELPKKNEEVITYIKPPGGSIKQDKSDNRFIPR